MSCGWATWPPWCRQRLTLACSTPRHYPNYHNIHLETDVWSKNDIPTIVRIQKWGARDETAKISKNKMSNLWWSKSTCLQELKDASAYEDVIHKDPVTRCPMTRKSQPCDSPLALQPQPKMTSGREDMGTRGHKTPSASRDKGGISHRNTTQQHRCNNGASQVYHRWKWEREREQNVWGWASWISNSFMDPLPWMSVAAWLCSRTDSGQIQTPTDRLSQAAGFSDRVSWEKLVRGGIESRSDSQICTDLPQLLISFV